MRDPACPASSTFGWSLERVSSFTYFLGDGIAVVSTLSFAATLTIVAVGFTTTGFPTLSVIAPVVGSTLYVVVIVLEPICPASSTLSWPFSRVSSFTYFLGDGIAVVSTLSFAATLTIVSVGFTTTGFPTVSVIAPVVGSTLYVVVVVLEPAWPASSTFGWSLARVSSFTYFLGDGIAAVSTLSLAPTFTTLAIGIFTTSGSPFDGVRVPFTGFTLYVVVTLVFPAFPGNWTVLVPFGLFTSFK